MYVDLPRGMISFLGTIAAMALVAFGLAYAVHRERLQKQKQYIAEYRRLYGSDPRFVFTL
jgi:hypothetical protein